MTWMVRKRFENISYLRAIEADIKYLKQRFNLSASLLCLAAGSILLIVLFFPPYWKLDISEIPLNLPTGVTEDGHPWIGNDSAPIVITEYSDYLCFQCKKMNFYLREIISQNPGQIKIIHRHFPMDSRFNPILKAPFHEGAGNLALIAIYAAENGKFWPANDLLFSIAGHRTRIDIGELASKLGLNASQTKIALHDRSIRKKLLSDIRQGLKIGITGTPSFVIENNVYHGQIPAKILNKIKTNTSKRLSRRGEFDGTYGKK
jgi:protein-disulfide isomerase